MNEEITQMTGTIDISWHQVKGIVQKMQEIASMYNVSCNATIINNSSFMQASYPVNYVLRGNEKDMLNTKAGFYRLYSFHLYRA